MAGGSVADLDYWRLTRSSASDAASGTCHPGNAASTSSRLAPAMSGRLRVGHTSSNTVASDAATAGPPAHRPALSPFQIVEGPCVEDQPEAGADTGRPQRRHIAAHEPHLDTCLRYLVVCSPQRLVDDIDARNLPTPAWRVRSPRFRYRCRSLLKSDRPPSLVVLQFLHTLKTRVSNTGRRHDAFFSWCRVGEDGCMLPTVDESTAADEGNVMRFAYVVLIVLPFLSGCASRPVVQNQQSASVLPTHQDNAAVCAGQNWTVCR